MAMSKLRRWHFWACFQSIFRDKLAREEVAYLESKGFKAKIWAPLLQHKTSGHTHVVVLCTTDELLKLTGVEVNG